MTKSDRKGLEALARLWRIEAETNRRQARFSDKSGSGQQSFSLGEAAGLLLAAKQLSEFLK